MMPQIFPRIFRFSLGFSMTETHPEQPRMPQPVAVGIRRRHVHAFKGPGPRGPNHEKSVKVKKMCGPILIFYGSYYKYIYIYSHTVCVYIYIYVYDYIYI